MTGVMRESSSSRVTGSAPGRVDSPPISKMVAPAAAICRPWAIAASAPKNRPPSEKLSGVTFTIPIIWGRSISSPAKAGRGRDKASSWASAASPAIWRAPSIVTRAAIYPSSRRITISRWVKPRDPPARGRYSYSGRVAASSDNGAMLNGRSHNRASGVHSCATEAGLT